LNGIYERNLANSQVNYFTGTASFLDAKTIETSEGKKLSADHIMISSGSSPSSPSFPGSEHCWSSDDIFTMERLPKSMIVIGGGYIGVEMAQIVQALGVKTTLLVRR
jgi:glutathione reductase (NADPH)|tara:strand:- start:133 stop:453 length:321 start_codon:yes stop_codon:yes gene_type:complete